MASLLTRRRASISDCCCSCSAAACSLTYELEMVTSSPSSFASWACFSAFACRRIWAISRKMSLSSGKSRSTVSKSYLERLYTSDISTARTVAVRLPPVSREISPKKHPGPSSAYLVLRSPLVTSTYPRRTKYISRPRSPSWRMRSPEKTTWVRSRITRLLITPGSASRNIGTARTRCEYRCMNMSVLRPSGSSMTRSRTLRPLFMFQV
mmetsp:Transcript_13828/g.43770  ORF Transcript_13828/g.43770 Transcript_13828/m.43770 type:complete len:209 (+) Transcript_13828:622-1248(+)